MKILIVRFSSIGDIVLTTPVMRCVKQQRPDIEVHYLTKKEFASIIDTNPYIDKRFYFDNNWHEIIEHLEAEKYDEIIDLHHNLRTLRIKNALKIKSHSFHKLNIRKWMFVNFKADLLPPESIVFRYLETVKHLKVHNDGKGLDYFIPDDVKVTTKDIPMSHWAGYAGCVIGGSYFTKKLPAAKWIELIKQTSFPVLLLGGAEDKAMGDEIAAADPIKIYNACSKFNLNESALLVKNANVIISNDTGLMHIAAAFQKPIISLWGNTAPQMGMFPFYGNNDLKNYPAPQLKLMEHKNLSCHPCSKIGFKKCPKKHFKCMQELNMQEAANAIEQLWTPVKK